MYELHKRIHSNFIEKLNELNDNESLTFSLYSERHVREPHSTKDVITVKKY